MVCGPCVSFLCQVYKMTLVFFIRHCPKCKALHRATKQLSHAPARPSHPLEALLIQRAVYRYFPLAGLELTDYMPSPLPPGIAKPQPLDGPMSSAQDPQAQIPPYKYDLYAVTNHIGSLSSGHCQSSFFVYTRPPYSPSPNN